jgi:HlyD family secretion protein
MNRIRSLVVPAMVAAALVSIAGCHSSSSATTQQTAPATPAVPKSESVTASPPLRKTLRRECVQPGQIEAFEQTPLFVKLPAYVEKLYVDIGDRVEANQLLVDLFLPELKDAVHQKEAALVQAEAEIELASAAVRAAEAAVTTAAANVSAAQAGTVRADADVARWQSQRARISQLVAGGSLDRKLEEETQDSLKAAEAARGEALAKVDAAKAALLQSQADLTKTKAGQSVAHARRGIAQADLSREKALLQYAQIRAPYAGIATERNVNRGDFAQPASTLTAKPLLTVARTDIVRIFVDVPEMDSPLVEPGRRGFVNVQALADRAVEGKVARTSWSLGANRTLRTEIDIANPNGLLRPGMYVTAHIVLQERPDVCALPLPAIVRDGKQTYCWVVNRGQVVRTPITLGLQVEGDAEIVSGLHGDESVVQAPSPSLQQGQAVEVAPPKPR